MIVAGLVLTMALQAGVLPTQKEVRDSRAPAPAKSATTKAGKATPAPRTGSALRTASKKKTVHRVIVDAGHGGIDPGAPLYGSSLSEKDIALQVALKVGAALKAQGIEVVYTRTRDTLIARADRGRIANQAEGDLFLSIHVNAANPGWKQPQAARGFETYFLGVAKTEDSRRVEEMEEESGRFESKEGEAGNNPLDFILNDMAQNEHLRESADLAEIVQRHLRGMHPGPDRGVKQAGFTVLVSAFMPAVLVEIGFGTNREEARFLASSAKQSELAEAISAGTREYLQRHERRVGSGAAGTYPGRND